MRKILKTNKIYKKIFILGIIIYITYIFLSQQKTLNLYKSTQKFYSDQLNTQLAYQESLYEKKTNINSKEYIEKVARDKLDMYLPNERVYIDKEN